MKDETRYFFASFVNREKSLTVLLKVLEKVQMDEVRGLFEYVDISISNNHFFVTARKMTCFQSSSRTLESLCLKIV